MKRYDVYSQSGCGNCDMQEAADGEYVLYEDVLSFLRRLPLEQLAEAILRGGPPEKVDG